MPTDRLDPKEFPVLKQFLSGYFNPDWDLQYDSAEEVIEGFVRTYPGAPTLPGEISRLLRLIPDEAELRRLLDFGWLIGYDPGYEGLTHTEWLTQIAHKIEQLNHNPDEHDSTYEG